MPLELARRQSNALREPACFEEVGLERLAKGSRGLVTETEALASSAECDESSVGTVAPTRGLGEQSLDAPSLGAQIGQGRLRGHGETTLVRRNARMRQTRAPGCLTMSLHRIARGGRGRSGGLLERDEGLVGPIGDGLLGLAQIGAQPILEPRGRLAAQRQPLARALETVQRAERSLPASGGIRELVLHLPPLLEECGQTLLCASPGDRDRIAA